MIRKFTAPSSCFALPCRPADSPTYGYGIVVKGLFNYVFRDREFSRRRSVLYPWTN
jgi:hypothetical protein